MTSHPMPFPPPCCSQLSSAVSFRADDGHHVYNMLSNKGPDTNYTENAGISQDHPWQTGWWSESQRERLVKHSLAEALSKQRKNSSALTWVPWRWGSHGFHSECDAGVAGKHRGHHSLSRSKDTGSCTLMLSGIRTMSVASCSLEPGLPSLLC